MGLCGGVGGHLRANAPIPLSLGNSKLRVELSTDGTVNMIENRIADETYAFRSDSFTLETDLGVFSTATFNPAGVTAEKQRVVFHYEFGPSISADLVYRLDGENAFFRRELNIDNKTPLRLKNLILCNTDFARPAIEVIH